MSFLLRLRPWQLFALTFGLPLLLQLAAGVAVALTRQVAFFGVSWLLAMLLVGLFFVWLWTLGGRLTQRLPAEAPRRLIWFKAALLLPLAYIVVLLAFLTLLFLRTVDADLQPAILLALMLPAHLLSMAGIFYALYFVAKTLKAVELQRPVEFAEYLGEFFLLWFFPVGIWFIQPRVNQLFANPAA